MNVDPFIRSGLGDLLHRVGNPLRRKAAVAPAIRNMVSCQRAGCAYAETEVEKGWSSSYAGRLLDAQGGLSVPDLAEGVASPAKCGSVPVERTCVRFSSHDCVEHFGRCQSQWHARALKTNVR